MTSKQLIAELKLIACGANGSPVVFDDNYFPNLQSAMYPAALANFAGAVAEQYFPDQKWDDLLIFGIRHMEKWQTFETLADAIISEQKRLRAAKGA